MIDRPPGLQFSSVERLGPLLPLLRSATGLPDRLAKLYSVFRQKNPRQAQVALPEGGGFANACGYKSGGGTVIDTHYRYTTSGNKEKSL